MSNDVETITLYESACQQAKRYGLQIRRVLEGFNLRDTDGYTLGMFRSVPELLAFVQGYGMFWSYALSCVE
jgi:hypothetical protein